MRKAFFKSLPGAANICGINSYIKEINELKFQLWISHTSNKNLTKQVSKLENEIGRLSTTKKKYQEKIIETSAKAVCFQAQISAYQTINNEHAESYKKT